jgi:hypothetical protein
MLRQPLERISWVDAILAVLSKPASKSVAATGNDGVLLFRIFADAKIQPDASEYFV